MAKSLVHSPLHVDFNENFIQSLHGPMTHRLSTPFFCSMCEDANFIDVRIGNRDGGIYHVAFFTAMDIALVEELI